MSNGRLRVAVVLAVGVATAAGTAGCGPDSSSARAAVERFLDAHYVRIDLGASLPLTAGLARQKVEREIALTRGVEIDDTTRVPRIYYRLVEEQESHDGVARFLYEATISPPGAERFRRRWLLLARRDGGQWLVTNYEELAE